MRRDLTELVARRCLQCRAFAVCFEVTEAAKSGDGTLQHVGIKLNGEFVSPVTTQRFTTQKALELHLKYLYDPSRPAVRPSQYSIPW